MACKHKQNGWQKKKKGSQTQVLKCTWVGASLSITTVIPHCRSSCLSNVMCFCKQSHILAYAMFFLLFLVTCGHICDIKSNSLRHFILAHSSHWNLSSWIIGHILDLKTFWTKGRKDTTRVQYFIANFQTQFRIGPSVSGYLRNGQSEMCGWSNSQKLFWNQRLQKH